MKYVILICFLGLICSGFMTSKPTSLHFEFSEMNLADTNKKKKKEKKRKKKNRISEVESAGDEDAWIDDSNIEDVDDFSGEETETSEVVEIQEESQLSPAEIQAQKDSIRRTRRNPRDSVAPAPMSNEELKSSISTKKYRRGELDNYEAMKQRLEELRELRDNSAWLVKQQRWELNDDGLKQSMETAFKIRQSYGILENEIREFEEERGKEAMEQFKNLVVSDIYDIESKSVNREILDELKDNLFFAKDNPQILCQGGVGRILGHLKGKIDGAQGCRGYISSFNNNPEFNLIIMQLDDGKRVAVIVDKNADSGSHGVLGVF